MNQYTLILRMQARNEEAAKEVAERVRLLLRDNGLLGHFPDRGEGEVVPMQNGEPQ